MKFNKAFLAFAAAILATGCTVGPAAPVASLRLQPPIVVDAAQPVVVAPAYYREHPGRGRGHHKRHH